MIDSFMVNSVLIRELKTTDFERVSELRNNPQIAKGTGLNLVSGGYSLSRFTRELQLADMYAVVINDQVQGVIILNEVVGELGEVAVDRKELSYYLNPELWSQGIMTQSLAELFIRLARTEVKLVQAEAFTENTRSTALLERLDFELITTLVDPFALKEKAIYELRL